MSRKNLWPVPQHQYMLPVAVSWAWPSPKERRMHCSTQNWFSYFGGWASSAISGVPFLVRLTVPRGFNRLMINNPTLDNLINFAWGFWSSRLSSFPIRSTPCPSRGSRKLWETARMEFGVTEAHDGIWSDGLKDVAVRYLAGPATEMSHHEPQCHRVPGMNSLHPHPLARQSLATWQYNLALHRAEPKTPRVLDKWCRIDIGWYRIIIKDDMEYKRISYN